MNKTMTILFIGNFEVPYSSENHYRWTFEKLGHKVIAIQENSSDVELINHFIPGIDLLFHVHTHGDMWNIKGIEQIYAQLKEKGIPTVGYHLDLFKGIKREINLQTDPYWNIEFFFTADKNFVPDLQARGIKAYYLPAGVVEKECYMAQPDKIRFPHDVIFVGSKGYHSEWPYRPKLVNWLQETYGDKFGHYGGDGLGTIRGHDLNVLYASAKVVVGDTLCINFNYPDYFSDRLFETTGRGGFMIFPFIEGLNRLFSTVSLSENMRVPEGYDIHINNFSDSLGMVRTPEIVNYKFHNFKQLKNTIDIMLQMNDYRESIRKNGHERTKRDHTYTSRLQYLLDTIQNDKNGQSKVK